MEEIRLVLEETAEDVDRKLEEIERSKYELVEGVKEYGGGKDEDLSVSVSDEDQLGVTSSRDDDMVRRRRSSSEDMMRRRRSSSSEDMMPRRRRSSSSSEDLVRLRRSSSSSEDLVRRRSSSCDDDMVRRRRSSSDEDMALRSSSDGEDQGGDDNRKADEDEDEDEDDDETEEDEDETEEDDDETEEEDDTEEWDENDGRWLPYSSRCLDPRALCTAGAGCTPEMAETIAELVDERNGKMLEAWLDIVNDNRTPLPARPVPILPKITTKCASGGVCYHREYWTDITSETEPNHPCFRPCEMLQVFSLRLSSTLAHSVNIYGTFAVRDCWEPCRNYLFRRSRDDPATIEPGCSFLPLCSPCRGIFVFQYLLLDIDLWIKEEGSIFPDRPLFSGYIELDAHLSGFGSLLKGRIQNGPLGLDMHYAFLYDGIETVIEVLAAAEYPSNVKISALTSGFDDEIALYDAIFCGTGVVARHFMSVRKLQMLHVFMKLDDSIYKWTFLAGVGVLAAPDGPISGFAQFEVNVSFRTKGKAASAWQWRGICNENVAEMCL